MKQPRKPTRANKELMSKYKLIWANWMVQSETKEELVVISKRSGARRVLKK